METMRLEALQEIVRTKGRDMYRHEYVKMAAELIELRARDKPREGGESSRPTGSDGLSIIRNLAWGLVLGQSIVVPDLPALIRYRITKEPW